MEAMTSSFPSSTHSCTQLDNIIFYPGPASKKTCESPADADEWPDIDEILAEAAQQDWRASIEQLDLTGGFDFTGEDIRAPTDTRSAAQAITSPEVHSEQVNTPPCTPLHQPGDKVLPEDAATQPQEEPDVSGGQALNMLTGASGTAQTCVQHNILTFEGYSLSGDDDITSRDYHFGDSARLDLGGDFRHEGSILTQTNSDLPSTAKTRQPGGQGLPSGTLGWLRHGPNSSTEAQRSDDSSTEERGNVQQPRGRLPTGEVDRDTTRLSEIGRPATEQEDERRCELDADVDIPISEAPQATVDQADSTSSTNAVDGENSDNDGPLLPSRRHQTRPSVRSCDRAADASSTSTPRSCSNSTEVESKRVLRRRKRLHRRKGKRHGSPTPGHDDSPATPATSTSSGVTGETGERWPVQCFFQRRLVGSRDVITIEFSAFDLRAPSEQDAVLSSSNQTPRTTPTVVAGRGSRHRARFTRAEEDLLVELKERRRPKLSWREIKTYFPNRTIGSLQVHFSTQLTGKRLSKRRALEH